MDHVLRFYRACLKRLFESCQGARPGAPANRPPALCAGTGVGAARPQVRPSPSLVPRSSFPRYVSRNTLDSDVFGAARLPKIQKNFAHPFSQIQKSPGQRCLPGRPLRNRPVYREGRVSSQEDTSMHNITDPLYSRGTDSLPAPLIRVDSCNSWLPLRPSLFNRHSAISNRQSQAFQGHLRVVSGSIWGRFGVDLGSIWGRFGVVLGSVWGRFGVGLGSV